MSEVKQIELPVKGNYVVLKANEAKERQLPETAGEVTKVTAAGYQVKWDNGTERILPISALVIVRQHEVEKARAEHAAAQTPAPAAQPERPPVKHRRRGEKPSLNEAKPLPICRCGCGLPCLTHRAKFLPGHDARLDSYCRKVAAGKATPEIEEAVNKAREAGYLVQRECGHWTLYTHLACGCTQTLPKPPKPKTGPTREKLEKQMEKLKDQLAKLKEANKGEGDD